MLQRNGNGFRLSGRVEEWKNGRADERKSGRSGPDRPFIHSSTLPLLHSSLRPLATACFVLLLALGSGSARAEVRQEDRALLTTVANRLLAGVQAPAVYAWPPKVRLVDDKEINAYASIDREAKTPKPQPMLTVNTGLMTQVI